MVDGAAEQERLGLRERKKLMTRRAILDVAEEMFADRGYDNVTVAEIADAVNISAKTVFVYFPSKEDLVFDDEDSVRDAIVAAVRDRAPGTTPLDAMAEYTREMLSAAGAQSVIGLDRLRRLVASSTVLQARMRLMWEHFELALAESLAEQAGVDRHAPEPRVAAAQLILVYRLMASDEVLDYVRSRPRSKQRAAFAHWLDVSVRMVGDGVGGYLPAPS
jgi:AcrR family transcriptional regulator